MYVWNTHNIMMTRPVTYLEVDYMYTFHILEDLIYIHVDNH